MSTSLGAPPVGHEISKGEQRMARVLLVVGLLLSALYMLLFAALPELAASGSAQATVAACGALACLFALAALRWRSFSLLRAMRLALFGAGVGSVAVAVLSGHGLGLLPLGMLPLLLCAAATLLSLRATLLVALAQAAALLLLAALELRGLLGPARPALDVLTLLLGQGGLLLAGLSTGLLMRRSIEATHARVKRREERFVGLLAVAADWYWETDAQLRFTHLSEQGQGGSGLAIEQRLGKTPWEIGDFGLDADAMDSHRADLESRIPFHDLLIRRQMPDGATRWLSVSGQPRFDARGVFVGYWGVGRDITTQHEAELVRQATEARYRELFTRSPSPLVLHRGGRVLDANVAALALFGAWTPQELIGQPLLEFYEEGDGSRDLAARRSAWLDTLPVGEATPPQQFGLRTTGGRRLTVQVTSVNIEAEGGPAILSIYRDETERLRAELARERSEALLSHVIATSPDLITLTDIATGRYVMVNDAFVALSGWTREEAIGRTSIELGVWGQAEARDRFVGLVREHGEVRNMAIEFRGRDGREFSLLVSAARFGMEGREYLVLNGRDVTRNERERLEREAILANASIGIALTRERQFQLVNPKFAHMFGWSVDELVGQPGAVTSVDEAAYEELGGLIGPRLARGEAVEFERMMRRRDGSTFLCRLLARPIDPNDPARGATIWIAEDVTERRAVQQALARARDEAEAASRAKSAFLANTSHEIRTPLNGLVGQPRLARQPGLDEARRRQYLAQIDESARALSGVISDILDLSKVEAGKLELEQAEFDLHALLESIEHGYAALAEARALGLSMHVGGGVPRRVRGDALRVRQILSNYPSNALKVTETGAVRVHVRGAGGDRIRFEVEDTGPGIAPAVQARLFMPFTQADDSTTRRYGGTGLGLSICRELAHLMGGDVGLDSEPGSGSRFWAELPLPAGDEDAPESAFAALDRQASPLVGLSLLIVEDNPVNMMIAVALLQQWGVEVTEAGNGAEAVALVAESADAGRPFDLVLMDVQMPVLGGNDATRELRRRFPADALPIIALTAAALTSERDDALAAGMNDFLTKPIDAQRLHDTLLRWGGTPVQRRLRRSAAGSAASLPTAAAPPSPPATAS
jgi:PAS domain S-box-containing protein